MWDRKLLKKNAKEAFFRNYLRCIAVCAIVMLLSGAFVNYIYNFGGTNSVSSTSTMTYVENDPEMLAEQMTQAMLEMIEFYNRYWLEIMIASVVVSLIVFGVKTVFYNVLSVGLNRYFLENREHKTSIGTLFHSFRGGRYGSTVWVMFLRELYILGWSLLFWIPGVIKSYSYMLVPYIMAENPNLDTKRVFQLSKEMMYGHKWEAFKLQLSFLGWYIASLYSTVLSICFVDPYMYATYAEFYSALKAAARNKGIFQPGELSTRLIVEEEANA